jgi:hypothetical protein
MSIRQSIVAGAAALVLSLPLSSLLAAPVNEAAPAAAKSTFTLIRGHGGGGGGGGGGGMGMSHGGMGMSHGGMGMSHGGMGMSRGGMGMSRGMGAGSFRSAGPSFSGQRFGSVRPNFGPRFGRFEGRRFEGGAFRGGRSAFYHGRRGHWRHGHWYPFYGLGVYAGGSCYWNCRAQGYGPGYCRAYAYDFCY